MDLYFSGIAGESEYRMLESAGVRRLLVDQFDLTNIPPGRLHVALDSGAYRAFKRNLTLDLDDYLAIARSRGPFTFVVALDAIGDQDDTLRRWEHLRRLRSIDDPPFIPVYQWGTDRDHLLRYLDESPIVGIGGLVTLMREKDERMLTELGELCSIHPQRFHVFGINNLKAIAQLKDLIVSGDTSKWLDGARYGHLVFVNTRTGRLSQAPAKALGLDLTREERCIQSARNLEAYLSGHLSS